jgi:hypothetical protein
LGYFREIEGRILEMKRGFAAIDTAEMPATSALLALARHPLRAVCHAILPKVTGGSGPRQASTIFWTMG